MNEVDMHGPDSDESLASGGQRRRVLQTGRIMVVMLMLGLLGLLGRVIQLQVDPPAPITARLGSQKSGAKLLGRRGPILDRRGRMVAVTRVARRLFVDPALIRDRGTFSERVAHLLHYNPIRIEKTVTAHNPSRYIVIDPRLSDQRLSRLRQASLPGLATEPVLVRDYPYQTLAGQLIGFVGKDGKGLGGLERSFNAPLAAAQGQYRYLRDASGRPLWVQARSYQPSRDGKPVRLSLDMTIQSIAARYLAQAVKKYAAASGQMIVIAPRTGEILAMADYPTFNPNHLRSSRSAQRRNRAVTDVFEPGSIFKPFVWSAATQLGIARPKETINTTTAGYWLSPEGRRLRDAHGHGRLTWNQVLIDSSNIGMAIVGERMGAKTMHRFVRAFGFGAPTGSGLPGEVGGIVHPLKRWTDYSITSIPMGQEIGVTGLQIVRAFSVFANGGLLITPTIKTADSGTARVPIQERVLSPAIADYTRRVLRRVVTEGTGRRADSDIYKLFGKTGTAQLPDPVHGGYYQDQYVSSFVGGGPLDAPRLVVGCFIHKPDKSIGHYGGTVAGPAVMHVLEDSLAYLGVPPEPKADR